MVNYILARGSPLMQGLLNRNKSDGYICLMHSGVKNKSLQTEQVTKYKKTKLRRRVGLAVPDLKKSSKL